MVDAVRWLLDAGRVKLYCVDSADAHTWSDRSRPARGAGAAARRVRAVDPRPGGALRPRRLRRPADDRHARAAASAPTTPPTSRCAHAAPVPAGAVPVRQLRPGDVARLGRARRRRLLQQPDATTWRTCTVTTWTGCARAVTCCSWSARAPGRSTRPARCPAPGRFADVLAEKGIRHELDVWGYDVPHDWPSWRAQLAHHLPRFC